MQNIKKTILISSIFLFSISPAGAGDPDIFGEKGWELVKEFPEEDVKIFYRTNKNGRVMFRGITHYRSSLSSFVELIRAVEVHPEFVFRTLEARVLKEVSEAERFAYVLSDAPWPFKKRDSVVHVFFEQNPRTLAVTISASSVSDFIPEDTSKVRVTDIASYWKFVPVKDGRIKIIFQGYGEPGGNIPTWVYRNFCKLLLWKMPCETFRDMKKIIKRERFQKARFSFIKEPR